MSNAINNHEQLQATKWTKGQSGNISGRPSTINLWGKAKALEKLSKAELEAMINDNTLSCSMIGAAQYMLKLAYGDKGAIEYVIDREEGRSVVRQDITQQVQGMHLIGQDTSINQEIIARITDTVTQAENAKNELMDELNEAIEDGTQGE